MRLLGRTITTLVLAVGLAGLVLPGAAPVAADPGQGSAARTKGHVTATPIGKPSWAPAGFQQFSAPIGTAASGYAEFLDTTLALLPEPNHRLHPELGVGPGDPHKGPYQRELADGVDAAGHHQRGPFALSEFSNGNGVWLVWMNVPRPGTKGSSPDFSRGRIIPNELFPIAVTGFSTLRGETFSVLTDFQIPALDATDPPFAVDGHSHIPVFIADNVDFGSGVDPVGRYSWHLRLVDQTGAGWQIVATFSVVA